MHLPDLGNVSKFLQMSLKKPEAEAKLVDVRKTLQTHFEKEKIKGVLFFVFVLTKVSS